jgi:hypothetical protein
VVPDEGVQARTFLSLVLDGVDNAGKLSRGGHGLILPAFGLHGHRGVLASSIEATAYFTTASGTSFGVLCWARTLAMAAIDQGWRSRASGVPIGGLGRRVLREARLAEPSTKVCQPAIWSAERAIQPRDAHPKTLTALNTSLSAASES